MSDQRRKLYWERTVDFLQRRRAAFMDPAKRQEYRAGIRKNAFQRIAHERRWGESLSGGGSTREYTRVTQKIVENVVRENELTSMLDVACGEFVWMPYVVERLANGFRYVGGDIVPDLVERHQANYPQHEFMVLDFVVDELPRCELILCRDVLQHLPVEDIRSALPRFSQSGAKYLLAMAHLRRFGWRNRRDKRVGRCHDRNLLLSPFNLDDPIAVYSEQDPGHKFLGLWKLPFEEKGGPK